MRVWREEIFGPVLSVCTFSTEAEALALANDCEFGLGGKHTRRGVCGGGGLRRRGDGGSCVSTPQPRLPLLIVLCASCLPLGAVISADPARCTRVAEALECGIVWVNCSQPCFCMVSRVHLLKPGLVGDAI